LLSISQFDVSVFVTGLGLWAAADSSSTRARVGEAYSGN